MTAGLPGTGIGGVFYLLCALIMPLIELINLLRGKSSLKRWLFIFRQLTMAAGIIAGMWLLGLSLGLLMTTPIEMAVLTEYSPSKAIDFAALSDKINIFHVAPVVMSIMTLSVVLLFANILRIVFRRNQATAFETNVTVQENAFTEQPQASRAEFKRAKSM